MKVLLDTCVWGGTLRHLETAGHDVIWTGNWPEDPGDEEILTYAHQEQRILVTLDKDFGEMAILFKRPHFGILRLVNIAARNQGPLCLKVLTLYQKELQAGAIITALDDPSIFPPETPDPRHSISFPGNALAQARHLRCPFQPGWSPALPGKKTLQLAQGDAKIVPNSHL